MSERKSQCFCKGTLLFRFPSPPTELDYLPVQPANLKHPVVRRGNQLKTSAAPTTGTP
jgi:hypothetical protein